MASDTFKVRPSISAPCILVIALADPVADVCHARGGNAGLPPVWLPYFTVADLDAALTACGARGGALVAGPKQMGEARYAVVRDPAGAHAALFQPAPA